MLTIKTPTNLPWGFVKFFCQAWPKYVIPFPTLRKLRRHVHVLGLVLLYLSWLFGSRPAIGVGFLVTFGEASSFREESSAEGRALVLLLAWCQSARTGRPASSLSWSIRWPSLSPPLGWPYRCCLYELVKGLEGTLPEPKIYVEEAWKILSKF